jgi:thymidylate kinase
MNERIFPKAICLVGSDGTGKTAHAVRILDDLQSRGQKCRYVWFGQPYLLANPFMFICNRLGYTKNHRLSNGITCQEHQYYQNKALVLIWPWIQLFDLSLIVFFRVYLPVWQGIIVVCDRFVPDTIVEVMTDIGDGNLISKTVGRLFAHLIPSFAVIIRLDVRAKTAFFRKTDVPDIRFLQIRRNNYDIISKRLCLSTLMAENSFDIVHKNIMQIIGLKNEKQI